MGEHTAAITSEQKTAIWKYALANAHKYEGTCNEGSVLAAMIQEFPEVKKNIPALREEIHCIVLDVNHLGISAIEERLQREFPDQLEKKEKEKKADLKELEDVDSKVGVVMRFAPSPSGPMHIGHAITGGLTSLYVKKYGGKFILRIEDTNSDNIDPDAYALLPKDEEWIFGNVTAVWIQSDRMETYYSYAEKMIRLGALYVCTCSQENFKEISEKMQDCPCRNGSLDENLRRWSLMFDKGQFPEGAFATSGAPHLEPPAQAPLRGYLYLNHYCRCSPALC
jgi:glutamyl-tRNA synthetase